MSACYKKVFEELRAKVSVKTRFNIKQQHDGSLPGFTPLLARLRHTVELLLVLKEVGVAGPVRVSVLSLV